MTNFLFIIKKEWVKLYKKDPRNLFDILYRLQRLKGDDLSYGISIYSQICIPINKNILINYIDEKVPAVKLKKDTYKILSFFEETYIYMNRACITIKSNEKYSSIYKIFHVYHSNIFVCNFSSKTFFWLDEVLRKLEF